MLLLGSGRKSENPVVEEKLFARIMDTRADGKPVSYSWIHGMAVENFQSSNSDSVIPQFSNFWIKKFLKRFDLRVRYASSSRADSNANGELIQRYTNEIKEII